MEIVGFVLAFVIGIIMGLIGAGGSILTSGILVYIFGFSPVLSASYTLLNVGVISLVGSFQYYRKDLVDINTGLVFALPAIIVVLCMRGFVMPAIPTIIFQYHQLVFTRELLIMLLFALMMITIAWSMLRNAGLKNEAVEKKVSKLSVFFIGIAVGILTGFVGAGGGFIIVPALIFFTALDVKKAVGTSLFIITINTSIGFISDFSSGVVYNWAFLSGFISVTVAGMLLSGLLVNKIKTAPLKRIFAVAILIIGCWIIVKEIFLT